MQVMWGTCLTNPFAVIKGVRQCFSKHRSRPKCGWPRPNQWVRSKFCLC